MIRTILAPATLAVLMGCTTTTAPTPPPTVPPPPPCPVSASSDWRAWVNAMPGPSSTRPTLHVVGRVVLPWSSWEARFTTIRVMESSPVQAVVELEFSTNSTEPKPATQVEVRGSWPSEAKVGSVTVMCNGITLTRISPVETAY